jgi:poly-beta-1,6-N-acetyl-D-glucosamine synthase
VKFAFWLCLLVLIYVYIGYPILLVAISSIRKKPVKKAESFPSVTLIIPAYNEERVIREKLHNAFSLDYPKEKLQIILASDGSSDHTVPLSRVYREQGLTLLDYPERRGKPGVLNDAVQEAAGEIIVFSDASSLLGPDAVRKLVQNFNDPQVGCVCGDYKLAYTDKSLRGQGEGLFVRYELFLKKKEAEIGSVLGLHGAIYAFRKEIYVALPADAINDDYILPAMIVSRGYRAVFEEEAVAYEKEQSDLRSEWRRRVRIAAGNVQQMRHVAFLFNPLRGMLFVQFLSHKVLRTMTPFALMLLFVSNMALTGPFYESLLYLQILFYFLALVGYACEKSDVRIKVLSSLFYFCLANVAVAVGVLKYVTRGAEVKWQRLGS